MVSAFCDDLQEWTRDGSGIVGVLQGRSNADVFKAKWSVRYPLRNWVFTKLFRMSVARKLEGFRIGIEQGRRLGFDHTELTPEFEGSPFECRCLVDCKEHLTRRMASYNPVSRGTFLFVCSHRFLSFWFVGLLFFCLG